MNYKRNPKTSKTPSGIVCCIPQPGWFNGGLCPNQCEHCFYQSGRSYLEPLAENLPNMPTKAEFWQIVRVNDGHDSNAMPDDMDIREETNQFPMKFYNTAIPKTLDWFDAPVCLTVNPGRKTDIDFYKLGKEQTDNLMFVRVRTNTWNLTVVDGAVSHYSQIGVPVVLTFMAYFGGTDCIPAGHRKFYIERKRTTNTYMAITTSAWRDIMARYENNKWIDSCGKIEGELGATACRFCGNCAKHYLAAMERRHSKWASE